MIPKSVADAVCLIWKTGEPACVTECEAEYMGLRLTTAEHSPIVRIQTASRNAAIDIEFESPEYFEESIDILFSYESVQLFSVSGDEADLEFVEFAQDLRNWRDIDSALVKASAVRKPGSTSSVQKALDLVFLSLILDALKIIHSAESPPVRVATDKKPLSVVTLFVPMSFDGVQTHVFLMPVDVKENGK